MGFKERESGRRPPVSSLRLYPEGVIRAVWQGNLEAPKALTMDSALAAVKAAEIVRENGSSAWKNAVPGRRLLFLGFFFAALIGGGSIKGLPAFCSRLEAVCCQKTFGELEKAESFRIFKHSGSVWDGDKTTFCGEKAHFQSQNWRRRHAAGACISVHQLIIRPFF